MYMRATLEDQRIHKVVQGREREEREERITRKDDKRKEGRMGWN
jgi:hypothetical protein